MLNDELQSSLLRLLSAARAVVGRPYARRFANGDGRSPIGLCRATRLKDRLRRECDAVEELLGDDVKEMR
jgi:hypothetical protein